MYRIYTDGSCKGNPGPGRGGWAYLIQKDDDCDFIRKKSGSESDTTNNRMELMAVIEGLKYLRSTLYPSPAIPEVEIVTDSTYVITVVKTRQPLENLKNADLVEELWNQLVGISFVFTHVKGHTGHPQNEIVDKLASSAAFKADWIGGKSK